MAFQKPGMSVVRRKRSGPKSKSSPYLGVTQYKRTGRYEAHIWISEQRGAKGRQHHLGSYLLATDAARCYDRAALKLRGPGAELNFPLEDYDFDEFMLAHSKEDRSTFLQLLRSTFSMPSTTGRGHAVNTPATPSGSPIRPLWTDKLLAGLVKQHAARAAETLDRDLAAAMVPQLLGQTRDAGAGTRWSAHAPVGDGLQMGWESAHGAPAAMLRALTGSGPSLPTAAEMELAEAVAAAAGGVGNGVESPPTWGLSPDEPSWHQPRQTVEYLSSQTASAWGSAAPAPAAPLPLLSFGARRGAVLSGTVSGPPGSLWVLPSTVVRPSMLYLAGQAAGVAMSPTAAFGRPGADSAWVRTLTTADEEHSLLHLADDAWGHHGWDHAVC